MKRKDFIKSTSLGLFGAMVVPQILSQNEVILGHNNKRYKINTKWSQADVARYPVNNCHEMVQDKKGRILLLTDETRNNVLIYDKYWTLGAKNTPAHMVLRFLMKTVKTCFLSAIITVIKSSKRLLMGVF
jgi:hypothetical protein